MHILKHIEERTFIRVVYLLTFVLLCTSGFYINTERAFAETMVYVTKSGEKYHNKQCGRGNFYQDTLSNAKSRGLEPCKKCFPNGAPTDSSTVTKSVNKESTKKKTVKLNETSIVLIVKQTEKLQLKNIKSKVTWSSSDSSVASVNSKGKVTAKKKSKATITATAGDVQKKCKVKVENPKLNAKEIELSIDSTYQLELKGCSHEVEWESDDYTIADVDENGAVYGIAPGTTNIIATVHGKEFVCTVVVKERQ